MAQSAEPPGYKAGNLVTIADFAILRPHPEVERLSNAELRDALADADERLETVHKLPSEDRDPMIEPWLVQERMIILAELRRRYAYSRPSDNSEQFAKLHFRL